MVGASGLTGAALEPQARAPAAVSSCRLGNGVEHVVYLQFDNLHLSREVASVPSDLEQMPDLLRFLEETGRLLSSNHTALTSHSGDDLLASLTGLYPDRHGQGAGDTWRRSVPAPWVPFTRAGCHVGSGPGRGRPARAVGALHQGGLRRGLGGGPRRPGAGELDLGPQRRLRPGLARDGGGA